MPEEEFEGGGEGERERGWTPEVPPAEILVETGRGNTISVPAGSLFKETVERIADEASYGGYFRVFLNGEEVVEPEEAPQTIEQGMRVAITSYDKVG